MKHNILFLDIRCIQDKIYKIRMEMAMHFLEEYPDMTEIK